jgi:protein phosphatase 1 regulatory subunit 37
VLTSEWGLVDLKLEGGLVETEDALKPILHALLVSGTLPSLSLVGNRKIKAGGWRLLAVFLKKVRCVDKVAPLAAIVVCSPCSGPSLISIWF